MYGFEIITGMHRCYCKLYTLQLVTGKHKMLYCSRAKHHCQLSSSYGILNFTLQQENKKLFFKAKHDYYNSASILWSSQIQHQDHWWMVPGKENKRKVNSMCHQQIDHWKINEIKVNSVQIPSIVERMYWWSCTLQTSLPWVEMY